MQTITITAAAEHGPAFSTLVLIALCIVVAGIAGWQLLARARSTRSRD
jgi:hypothetical protein